LQTALGACTDGEALRAYLERAETWLSRLRRTQPDRAARADAMVSAAWERVRGREAEDAALPLWAIVGSDGGAVEYAGRDEWVAA
jgi:hypothetical protein